MHPEKHVIVGVHITDRIHHASAVQDVLTDYGCEIKTRLGLHEVGPGECSPNGLLVLELVGDEKLHQEMVQKLDAIQGVETKQMTFTHLA